MQRVSKLLPLALVVLLSSCSMSTPVPSKTLFLFDTAVTISSKDATEEDFNELTKILGRYDAVSDNFKARDVFNVYSWKDTEEEVYCGHEEGQAPIELLYMVYAVQQARLADARHLDIRLGSLINKWKEAEKKGEVLSESVINEELEKRNASSYMCSYNKDTDSGYIQQYGVEAFDFGAVAKGRALDACKAYLDTREEVKDYIIDAGSSSILLGKSSRNKDANNISYRIKIKDLNNSSFLAHDCFVSTSGTSEQGITINGVRYSHIINPHDGNAVTNYDTIIVISDNGAFGDIYSTSMMFNTIEEIKQIEQNQNFKTIVIKDKRVVYKNQGINID